MQIARYCRARYNKVYTNLFISFFDVPSTAAAAAAVVFTLQFISAVTLLYIQADLTKKWKLKNIRNMESQKMQVSQLN
jgi:hypothetical protein